MTDSAMNPASPSPRSEAELRDAFAQRILVFDGAMGTGIQACELTAADYGGAALDGCHEVLNRTRPDVIRGLHGSFLSAGADVVQTNTFGGTRIVLAEYGLGDEAAELAFAAAQIAREAADGLSSPEKPRFVAGSLGPTTRAISVTGGVTFGELRDAYREQVAGLLRGGVDLLLLETQQDTRNAKAALLGIRQAMDAEGIRVPVSVSCTIEPNGTMLAGQTAEAFWTSVSHVPLLSVGLNCATGPRDMADSLRSLSALATAPVSCMPNAGLPDMDGLYRESPADLAAALEHFMEEGWLNAVGGCCGTTPDHIRRVSAVARRYAPRPIPTHRETRLSGIDVLEFEEDARPILVGERTNVIGSRRFNRLIGEKRYAEAAEIARRQVDGGAQIIDVNLQNPDRDELEDCAAFYPEVLRRVRAPVMIDTTSVEAVRLALTECPGKSVVNSVNLEDGGQRMAEVCELVRGFGAALVVGLIDDDPDGGMAVTLDRKLAVARKCHAELSRHGIPPEDILWDTLVFPAATGDAQYAGAAGATLEAIPALKREFPGTKTILGISNVSFGLPVAAREVLNSVFLHRATRAGLDFAIVNTERLERHGSIPPEDVALAEDLLFGRGEDTPRAFADRYRDALPRRKRSTPGDERPIDERLSACVVEGRREGLIADLDRKRADGISPMEVINGPLLRGMAEVGRLFNDNQLIVAEVLQSAEVMKVAVSHLEADMDAEGVESRGTIVLATVKGDVHDIGKNLVEIVLSNNGYRVVDLGIRVAAERIVEAASHHRPMAVGLSGLLVKSAREMVTVARELHRAEQSTPLLVGGAALSSRFVDEKIAPEYGGAVHYAKDAMAGLDLCGKIRAGEAGGAARPRAGAGASDRVELPPRERSGARSAAIPVLAEVPQPPDEDRHLARAEDLSRVWPWIHPQALYGRHLGIRGRWEELLARGDPRAIQLEGVVAELMSEAEAGAMRTSAVWQWFRAESCGNVLRLLDGGGEPLEEFVFRRQARPDGLCVADWCCPAGAAPDWVALLVTTAGRGIREKVRKLRDAGEYLRSHALGSLAVETAEAHAEMLHADLRSAWGFPDAEGMSRAEVFRSRYRGVRVSFGYPACPDLEDQAKLFRLLRPEEIGVELTGGFMMDPEASVSAMVFHHPDAAYFSLGRRGASR
jgi:5-methyltetrahydrofolate--homocysteine methyltransferase